MELYHWYKNGELPDRECDCVVISQDKRTEKTIKEICQYKKTQFGKIFIDHYGYHVPQICILFYMPIEFPKEVE